MLSIYINTLFKLPSFTSLLLNTCIRLLLLLLFVGLEINHFSREMSEKFLFLLSASSERYFIIGTDFPCARVFDCTESSLACSLTPSKYRHSPSNIALTAVAVGSSPFGVDRSLLKSGATALDSHFAAAGLSNGSVILHNVTANEPLGDISVSSTQQPVISLCFAGGYLWCLCEDHTVYLIRLSSPGEGVCFHFDCQSSTASALAVRLICDRESSEEFFDVLVAGTTTAVFRVTTLEGSSSTSGLGRDGKTRSACFHCEKLLSFASHGGAVKHALLRPTNVAATSSPQDCTIKLWDVQCSNQRNGMSTEGISALSARCRRTLSCGQRIADFSVLEGSSRCFVSATTFTGAILIWDLGSALLPSTPEPLPLAPSVILYSAAAVGRLLLCRLVGFGSGTNVKENPDTLCAIVVRGRFAFPHFEMLCVGKLPSAARGTTKPQQQRSKLALLSSLAVASSSEVALREVPLSRPLQETLELQEEAISKGAGARDAAFTAYEAVDSVWGKQHVAAVAARSNLTAAVSFPPTKVHRAGSTADLPVNQLTLEERIRKFSTSTNYGGDHQRPDLEEGSGSAPRLGLATVPLYQALHASDISTVMELLSVAARSEDGIRSTVLNLQLPYCLQLLEIISERLGIRSRRAVSGAQSGTSAITGGGDLGTVSSRTPLLLWIEAIIHYRGLEMYQMQVEYDKEQCRADAAQERSSTLHGVNSPPRDFVAPLLHQYRRMTSIMDSIATLHGRLSIFIGVRASEKNKFVNRSRKMLSSNLDVGHDTVGSGYLADDIVFPLMFAEIASRRRGNYSVRVHNKASLAAKKRRLHGRDAELMRRAKKLAGGTKKERNGLLGAEDNVWDDILAEKTQEDGEVDLEAMEGMDLDSSDSSEEPDSDDDRGHKRGRDETDEMLADEHSSEDSEGSSAGDLSQHSGTGDDSVISAEEEDEEEDEEETEDEEDFEGRAEDSNSHSDDDGIGEEMRELLEETGGGRAAQSSRDRRAHIE